MRNKTRLCILILTVIMLLSAAGCGDDASIQDDSPQGVPEPLALVTVDGKSISDEEVYYFLYSSAYTMERYFSTIDWESEISGVPIPEYIKNDAIDTIRLYYAINRKADSIGCGLTDEQRVELEAARAEEIDYYGGEDAFINQLKAEGLTEELYAYFNETTMLYRNIKESLFGEGGSELPTAEQLNEYIEEREYICVTHILLSVRDDSGEPLAEAEIEQRRELAGEILARAEAGGDFFALLAEFGEDPGVSYEPYYYNMRPGYMVEEFEKAAYALDENAISGIVETDYGFHIIKRLPMEPESLLDEYCENTLARLLDEWGKELPYSSSDEFDNLDVKAFYEGYWHDLIENNPDVALP